MANSLELLCDDKVVYASNKPGLRPLFMCMTKNRGRNHSCTLYDKVVGLAAARLIVISGIVSIVITPLASKPAVALLRENMIEVVAEKTVDNILTKDRKSICPMEKKALKTGNKEFFEHANRVFS